jgi:hypothetical protein
MDLLLDTEKRYTYADYLTWLDDKQRELFNGFVKLMSECQFFHAPFDEGTKYKDGKIPVHTFGEEEIAIKDIFL